MTDIPKDAKCSHTSFAGFGFGRKHCCKPAKMEHDGKFYCGIHDPVRIKAKRKAQSDKWRAEADAERAARQAAADKQAALELDAARYRWLRERDWFVGPLCIVRDPQIVLQQPYMLGRDCPSRERLDAAIDAAMRG